MGFARNVGVEYFMDDGLIAEEGPPEQVFDQPQNPRTINFFQSFT